jgi:Peptidase MA superfamily
MESCVHKLLPPERIENCNVQRQTRLNHILFVCFWTLASLALIIGGLFANAAPVSRPITFERSAVITTVRLAQRSDHETGAPAATSHGYGQPAPKANLEAAPTETSQPPTPAAASSLQASTPLAQTSFHTLRAAASDKLAWAPTATSTPAPSPTNQPTAARLAAKPVQVKPTPTRPPVATPLTAQAHPYVAVTSTAASPRPLAPTPIRPAARATAPPTLALPPTAIPPAAPPDNGPLTTARAGIIALLTQRQQAVSNLDGDSFINTVDPQANSLRQEQTVWFDDLRTHPTSYYALELGGLSLSGSDRAVGTLTERSQVVGRGVRNVSAAVIFVRRDGQWYYDDLNFETLANEHFRIRFFPSNRGIGNALFSASLRTYAQISADLGAAPAGVMEVKLYPSEDLLQDSVMLTLPQWVGGWSMPGQSIKTAYNGAPAASYVNLVAHEFTHQAEASLGLNHSNSPDWLNEGLAVYEAERISTDGYEVANRAAILRKARTGNSFFAWSSFPTFQQVAGGQVSLAYEQAYSAVQYLLEKYGRDRFNAMLGYLIAGNGLDEAFTQAFGVSLADFDSAWRVWLAAKYR